MKICPLCEKEFGDEIQTCPDDYADLMPLITDPLIGSVIEDRYRITEVIGVGSMGVVYRAVQEAVSREVAIKVLPKELASNRQAVKRFHHEAKAASRLNHPHIITVYDFGIAAGGQPFIAMELLDGITMDRYLVERKRLELFEALPIVQQMCEAIGEAHNQGLIHRDIKPANIALVERGGRKNHVIILDFGIAKGTERLNDPDSTAPGVVFGSPVYMSPERFLGQSGDVRSDVYSLAVVIFQMLSGAVPFKSTDLINLISSHVIAAPPTVSSITSEATIPAAMEQVLQRALSKSPNDRPQAMQEFWEEIHRACKPRAGTPNMVQEGIRPLDPTGNASTHDVFKRLEGLLSDAPTSPEAMQAAIAEEVATASGAGQGALPATAAADSTSTPANMVGAPGNSVGPPMSAPNNASNDRPFATAPAPASSATENTLSAATNSATSGPQSGNTASGAPGIPQSPKDATGGSGPPRPYRNAAEATKPALVTGAQGVPQQSTAPAAPAPDPSVSPGPSPSAMRVLGTSGAQRPLPRNFKDNSDYDSSPSGRFASPKFTSDKSNDSASSHGVLVTLLVLGVILAGAGIMGIFMTHPQSSPKYVQSLLAEGKLDDAGHVLALMRTEKNRPDAEAMDQLSMSLAREYVRVNRLPAAIQSLQQIPPRSTQYDAAQSLIKTYRDKLGI